METSAKVARKDFCLKGIFSVFFDPIATRSCACLGITCSYTLSYCVYHQWAKFFLANMVFLGASALSLTYEIYSYVTSVIQQILGYACANSKACPTPQHLSFSVLCRKIEPVGPGFEIETQSLFFLSISDFTSYAFSSPVILGGRGCVRWAIKKPKALVSRM